MTDDANRRMKGLMRRIYAASLRAATESVFPGRIIGLDELTRSAWQPCEPPGRPLATPHVVHTTPEGRVTHFNGTPLPGNPPTPPEP